MCNQKGGNSRNLLTAVVEGRAQLVPAHVGSATAGEEMRAEGRQGGVGARRHSAAHLWRRVVDAGMGGPGC